MKTNNCFANIFLLQLNVKRNGNGTEMQLELRRKLAPAIDFCTLTKYTLHILQCDITVKFSYYSVIRINGAKQQNVWHFIFIYFYYKFLKHFEHQTKKCRKKIFDLLKQKYMSKFIYISIQLLDIMLPYSRYTVLYIQYNNNMAVAVTLAQCLRISSSATSETRRARKKARTHIFRLVQRFCFFPICRKLYVFYRSLPFYQHECSMTSFYARVGRLIFVIYYVEQE